MGSFGVMGLFKGAVRGLKALADRLSMWWQGRAQARAEEEQARAQVAAAESRAVETFQKVAEISGESPDRRLCTEAEIAAFETMLTDTAYGKRMGAKQVKTADGETWTMAVAFEKAKEGNYAAFENLNPAMKNVVASKKMHQLAQRNEFNDMDAFTRDYRHDTAVRLGLSHASNMESFNGKERQAFADAEHTMTMDSFRATFSPITPENEARLRQAYKDKPDMADDMIARQQYSQRVMLKLMYAAQMGNTTMKNQQKEQSPWNADLAEMLSTGGRVGFILPASDKSERRTRIVESIYGINLGQGQGNESRTAATHAVDRQTKGGKSDFKEVKTWNPFRIFRNQYGLDLAGGGLGALGTSGRMIQNDGCSGHLYSHIRSGNASHHGALLVGIESDAPGKRNFNGHQHTASAKPESNTCFGAQKTALIGRKYDGRTVDLSGMNEADFIRSMDALDMRITQDQRLARNGTEAEKQAARERLSQLTMSLTGPVMSRENLTALMAPQPVTEAPAQTGPERQVVAAMDGPERQTAQPVASRTEVSMHTLRVEDGIAPEVRDPSPIEREVPVLQAQAPQL